MTLGEHLKICRRAKKMTQKELAKILGLSEISIRKYEADERKPPYLVSLKINSVFNAEIYEVENDKSLRLVDLNLQGISPSDELLKVQEENKEFEMAILECLCNPIKESKLHAIEEFWDKVQSSLSYLQITLDIKADEVMENYNLHLEKIKNRPR